MKSLSRFVRKVATMWNRNISKISTPPAEASDASPLCPGVYANSRGNKRILLAVVGRRVIYTWNDEKEQIIRLTTCSAKTFTNSAGMKLVRAFSATEITNMKSRAFSLRSRRCCNRAEEKIFFGAKRIPGLMKLISRKASRPEIGSDFTNPDTAQALAISG